MASMRRTFGGFVVAAAVAVVLVLTAAPVHAKGRGNAGGDVCDTINRAIEFITNSYDEPVRSLLLQPWLLAADIYDCE